MEAEFADGFTLSVREHEALMFSLSALRRAVEFRAFCVVDIGSPFQTFCVTFSVLATLKTLQLFFFDFTFTFGRIVH